MKKYHLRALVVTGLVITVTSCVMPKPFTPKALNDNAKGITTVRATPYGCKALGEIEGFDEYQPTMIHPDLAQARLGAMNDLRNNAVEVVGSSKRITLRIIGEKATCLTGNDCPVGVKDSQLVRNYRVLAQIFECGNKE